MHGTQTRGLDHVVVAGPGEDWPPDFDLFIEQELVAHPGVTVARIPGVAEALALLERGEATALIVNAERVGTRDMLALRECRRLRPGTSIVVVSTGAARTVKDALDWGATAYVKWPATTEALRRAIRLGVSPPGPRTRPRVGP